MLRITGIVMFVLFLIAPAEARQRHAATGLHPMCNITMPCEMPYASTARQARETRGKYVADQMGFGAPRHATKRHVSHREAPRAKLAVERSVPTRATRREVPTQIVAHPEGCPSRAFCGCGAAVRIFGHSVRELWLVANWFKFPRAAPAPGMAAVRRHHVMVLEADLGGGVWKVYDANSGRHATRIHARSIAGYTIVSPRA
jgi:hypothetical protein